MISNLERHFPKWHKFVFPRQISSRTLILSMLVIALLLILFRSQSNITNSATEQPGGEFGQILEGAGRANFDWFKKPGVKFGIAFKAVKSGKITHLIIPWRYTIIENNPKKSYGWGNFGTYNFELQSNGMGNIPSGEVIAITTNVHPPEYMLGFGGEMRDDYPLLLSISAELVEKKMYHLVISNIDPDPTVNWSSVNTVMTRIIPWGEWATFGNDARGEAFSNGKWNPWASKSNPWNAARQNNVNGSRIPLIIRWLDGSVTGDPYWSAMREHPVEFSANSRAGELISWNKPSVNVYSIGLAVKKVGKPAGSINFCIEDTNGEASLTDFLATADDVETGEMQTWVYALLSQPFALKTGHQYRLWFSAPEAIDSKNCYKQYSVYFPNDASDNWFDLSWGARECHLIVWETSAWHDFENQDLTFSLRTRYEGSPEELPVSRR